MAERVGQFDRARVRPSAAAVGGDGAAAVTKFIGENPVAGPGVRARLRGSMDDTQAAVTRQADAAGTPRPTTQVGEAVQEGVRRFVRDPSAPDSFRARSSQLYDDAFAQIPNQPVDTAVADGALTQIINRVGAPTLAQVMRNPELERIAAALTTDAGQVSFTDLRALRTWVREMQAAPSLTQNIPAAQLQQLERALSQDIAANAQRLGGDRAATALRRADQYYAAGQARIESALKAFDNGTGEGAYNRIVAAASEGGKADIRQLNSLKRSLRPDEWGDVSATVISRMGKPPAGTAAAADELPFSINTFVTNYNKLSPQGRAVLFGSVGGGGSRATNLQAELDNLAQVADMQKNVERAANSSKSMVGGQIAATTAGLVKAPVPTLFSLAGLALTGEMLTNPTVVRWLSRLGSATSPQALAQRVNDLRRDARRNPALLTLVEQIDAAPARAAAEEEGSGPAQ